MSNDQATPTESEQDELTRIVAGIFARRGPEEARRLCVEAFGRALERMPVTPEQREQARAELTESLGTADD